MRKEQLDAISRILVSGSMDELERLRKEGNEITPEVDFLIGFMHGQFRTMMDAVVLNYENEIKLIKRRAKEKTNDENA